MLLRTTETRIAGRRTGVDVRDSMVKALSTLHTTMYRATRGRLGTRLVSNDMLLLTTTGRRTGAHHTVPLLYLRGDDRLIVIASYGGRSQHPEWYLNLLKNPAAIAQTGSNRRQVLAETMNSSDRTTWWPRVVDAYGDYAVYQGRTEREIPLVWLIDGA